MDERRQKRVAEAIRDELTELIVYELEDPRIQVEGITDVHISPDGKRADVLLRTAGDPSGQQTTLEGLQRAKGLLKKQLAARLSLRQVPELRFLPDTGASSGDRMEVLLKRAQKWRRKLDRVESTTGRDEDS